MSGVEPQAGPGSEPRWDRPTGQCWSACQPGWRARLGPTPTGWTPRYSGGADATQRGARWQAGTPVCPGYRPVRRRGCMDLPPVLGSMTLTHPKRPDTPRFPIGAALAGKPRSRTCASQAGNLAPQRPERGPRLAARIVVLAADRHPTAMRLIAPILERIGISFECGARRLGEESVGELANTGQLSLFS